MGCVQSYFKKAHNAGMSPSSTQGSEKAPLGEKEIKAQEETDDVQTAEIVRDFATVDEGELKTIKENEDAKDSEANSSTVFDAVATTAAVAGVGAATAVAAAKIAENVETTQAEGNSAKKQSEEVPFADMTENESALTEKPQECDESDTQIDSKIADDASKAKRKTETEDEIIAESSSPVTSEQQRETSTPQLSSRPVSAVILEDTSDSVTRRNEQLSCDAVTAANGLSNKQDDLKEATILEEPIKETDGFVVLDKYVDEKSIPITPVDVDTRPNENEISGRPKEEVQSTGENTNDIDENESEEQLIVHPVTSRPSSTETHKIDDRISAVDLTKENASNKCETVSSDAVNELSRTSSAEPDEKEISSRPTSISNDNVEETGKNISSAKLEEATSKTAEECSDYSPSIDSAEDVLISRPLSVASEHIEESTKEQESERHSTIANGIVKGKAEKYLNTELAEEADLNRSVTVTSEEPAKEFTQTTPISLRSEGSPSIESAEEAVPSRPISVNSETSAGPTKVPTPTIPSSLDRENNGANSKNDLTLEAAEEVQSNRSLSAASETTDKPETTLLPTTVGSYEDHIKVIPASEVIEEAKEIIEHEEIADTSEENAETTSSTEEKKAVTDPLDSTGEMNKDHIAIPTSEEVTEEVISSTSVSEANEPPEEHIEKSSPVISLEETDLSKHSNDTAALVEYGDDLSAIEPKEGELLSSGVSEAADKLSEKPCSPESSENIVSIIPIPINRDEVVENFDNTIPTEAAKKELKISPISTGTEAIENHYENISPAEPAEETSPGRPLSAGSEIIHIPKMPSPVDNAEDITSTPPSLPIQIELSEECMENQSDVSLTEDIPELASKRDNDTIMDRFSHDTALEKASTPEFINNTSYPVCENIEKKSPIKATELEDSSRPPSESNEGNDDKVYIPSSTKFEEETISKEQLSASHKNDERHDKLPTPTEPEKENIPSSPLSMASETSEVMPINHSPLKSLENTLSNRPGSVVNETSEQPISETSRSEALSVSDENTEQLPESVKTTITSPTLCSPEISPDMPHNSNSFSEATVQEVDVTAKSDYIAEAVPENTDDVPDQTGMNQQNDTAEAALNDEVMSKETVCEPCMDEKLDAAMEDSGTVDNDTDDVEKEDSTIASIPESIMTVPESMGDMELSSESSIGGTVEKSLEEARYEENKPEPDEQEDSSLIANLTDEPDTDVVAQSSASENEDVKNFDTVEHKEKITKAVINGVEDDNTNGNMYADAFGRPVPTITLFESEEPKRSDSEEENVETMSPETEDPNQVPEEKETEVHVTKESVEMVSDVVNNSQEDEEGEKSESVAGSDSINLHHRDDGRSDSGTSQSRADSVVAEKGSEVDSITTVSAAPSADGARRISGEDQDNNFKESSVLQSPTTLDGASGVPEVALNTAATTIQATFRGYQTRQALQKSVETPKVPTGESQPDSGDRITAEYEITSNETDIPRVESKAETKGDDTRLETSGSSLQREEIITDYDDREPPENTCNSEDDLADLQKPQECDELPEHRGGDFKDGKEISSSGDADSSLSSAATKIQAGFRGYKTRKQMRDNMDDSAAMSLTNEPSIPDSQQSFGTFSTSAEDNGVCTSGSLETAVQRQQQSTLDEIEELVGSGPPLLVDAAMNQVETQNFPDDGVPSDIEMFDEKEVNEAKEAIRGLSLDSKVDESKKSGKTVAKPSSLQDNLTMDNEEDQKVWDTLQSELSQAATKIQSNYRGYRARQKLTREDAVQLPTTSTSSAASVDSEKMTDTEVRASGEFHDMMVLPPGEITKLTNGDDAADITKA